MLIFFIPPFRKYNCKQIFHAVGSSTVKRGISLFALHQSQCAVYAPMTMILNMMLFINFLCFLAVSQTQGKLPQFPKSFKGIPEKKTGNYEEQIIVHPLLFLK